MSEILTIHVLSPFAQLVPAAILANRQSLSKRNLKYGPVNTAACEAVPTQLSSLFTFRAPNLPIPPIVKNHWAEISSDLDSGKNVILNAATIHLKGHQYFYDRLVENVDLSRHSIRSLFFISNPLLRAEQFYRGNVPKKAEIYTQASLENFQKLPDLLNELRQRQGQDSVEIYLTSASSALATIEPAHLERISQFIKAPLPVPEEWPMLPLRLRSRTSRRLFNFSKARWNRWPYLDKGNFNNSLLELDEELPEDFISPQELREELARTAGPAIAAIEELAGMPHALDIPPGFVSHPQAPPLPEVPRNHIKKFFSMLNEENRSALASRLKNDLPLLNDQQRKFLDTLKDDFGQIGNVEAPVELTVLTMAYNHEKYIAACMDSVLAQKCDFPIRHIVLDHNSDDATPDIIAEYASKHPSIQPVLLSRRIPSENVKGLFARCRSRYASLCDGDDFFTEPYKLQKQVDFLESHPDYALTFHPVLAVFEDGRKPEVFPPLSVLPKRKSGAFYLADLMKTNFIQTNSVVYRWRFVDGLPEWFHPDLCPGDWYWHILHAETGKIGFIPEVMSAYRRHSQALYADAWKPSSETLRAKMGMSELYTYKIVNEHFKGRYYRDLSLLASGVFSDFVKISFEGDSALLDQAVEKYPDFAKDFLYRLKLNAENQEAPDNA